jgi:PAS domain S-box-containing protein
VKKEKTDQLLRENKVLKKKIKTLEYLLSERKTESIPFSFGLFYRALFRLSPYSIIISRLKDGKIYDVSDHFCKTTGFSRKEILGKTGKQLNLWPKGQREKMINMLLRDGQCNNWEVEHRLKNGTLVACLDSGILITVGKEQYIIFIVTDIMPLKKIQASLTEERDLSNALINSLPGIFYIVDEDCRLLRWNNNVMKITGYSTKTIQKKTAMDFLAETHRNFFEKQREHLFLSGEYQGNTNIMMKDGSVRTFFLVAKKLNYQNKDCIIGTGIDVTEKKKMFDELKQYAERLEEANTAMRVLINQNHVDQRDLEQILQTNINELVLPYLQKLKRTKLDDRHQQYVTALENTLKDVLSPLMRNLRWSQKSFTPQEMQIINLIKQGKKSKEIAEMLNASVKTVETHRNNIRKKLGLVKAKVNLRSHILNII